LVLRFCFEACLTGMVASSVRFVKSPGKRAPGETGAQGLPVPKTKYLIEFHLSHDRNRDITAFGSATSHMQQPCTCLSGLALLRHAE